MNDNDMVQVPRSVLAKIQWQGDLGCEPYCDICYAQYTDGHKEDCPIGKALSIVSQHEMKIGDDKYVTKLSVAISSSDYKTSEKEVCSGRKDYYKGEQVKFYIAMMYLFAIIMAIYPSKVAAIIGIPVLLTSFLSICLLVISGVVIYCAECVREIRPEMDKESK